jgi:hypothetical protein
VSSTLNIDVHAIRATAAALRSAAAEIPLGSPLDLSACGSSVVAAAAENFNMWARFTAEIAADKVNGAATSAEDAATAFAQTDSNIAAGVTP